MLVRVALVEDEKAAADALQASLLRYGTEHDIRFDIRVFPNAMIFLEPYTADYDVVFMDIQMPLMNGMDAAHLLREADAQVLLVFVTSLTQYAIQGYEVDAMDYIVKPVRYYDFALKLGRVLRRLPQKAPEITVSTETGLVRLSVDDIRYVEVLGHHVLYHTLRDELTQYGTMSKAEAQLAGEGFARCNNCYLVNLRYVSRVDGYMLHLGDEALKISQPRKKAFLEAWRAWQNRPVR